VGASSYRFSHGRRKADQQHGNEKIIVRGNSWREVLFELPHENAGFEALHFHGEEEQFKIGLPFALPNCPSKAFLK
jgi:hypothetical protein